MEQATFGAGCFWGVEATFRELGLDKLETEVGFMGGTLKDPSYKQVCQNNTGHAEVVHIKFDNKKITYKELLQTFWSTHDPTQGDRQGPDIGDQYRSVIFYHTETQKQEAIKSKELEQKKYKKPITTQIVKAEIFYRAEQYHQRYLEKHGKASCHI